MSIGYVLIEKDHLMETVVGVFKSPIIDNGKLKEYLGGGLQLVGFRDIQDSGVEWEKTVICDGCKVVLTMLSFEVGEL